MTSQPSPPAHASSAAGKAWIVAVVAPLVTRALALNRQSLWIDELGTWRLTRADSLPAWLRQLPTWRNPDSQLPLHHAWIKLWASVVAREEWLLRASNLPWIVLAFFGTVLVGIGVWLIACA
jgi:hypothetical protein